jgi:superfamily II DNA or RNA helicase
MDKTKIQEIALKHTHKVKRCGLGLATGVGKTLLGLKHMEKEYSPLKKYLVVAPKKAIMEEWRSQAVLFNKTKVISITDFTTYRSLNKQNPKDYDVIYLDECHSLLESHREFLSQYNGKILGLTGTPPKYRGSEKGMMVYDYCPIVWNYLTDEAIDDKILNDYKIVVHMIQLTTKPVIPVTARFGKLNFNTSERKSYNYWSRRLDNAATPKEINIARIQRMKALKDFPSKERYTKILAHSIENTDKDKCLIFANTQEQADKLSEHSYHSNNINSEENLKLFKEGKINRLSCVLQLSEGVNIPNLKQGIIMHAYGNERKASQRIGRLLRLNPDDTSIIHILCYKDTIDETWVSNALDSFDSDKVIRKDFNIKIW